MKLEAEEAEKLCSRESNLLKVLVFNLEIYHASVLFFNQLIQEETCQKGQMYPTSLYAPGASRRLSVVVRETLSEEGTIGGLYTQLSRDSRTHNYWGIVQNTY